MGMTHVYSFKKSYDKVLFNAESTANSESEPVDISFTDGKFSLKVYVHSGSAPNVDFHPLLEQADGTYQEMDSFSDVNISGTAPFYADFDFEVNKAEKMKLYIKGNASNGADTVLSATLYGSEELP